ncbi:MAG: ATP-binding cassette domain-containing protein, partial [Desulfobacteraceae bacterium]|nr:ATP-binding cassette domain-containing protein [Desulfobacteraceae bacterium]
MIRIEDLHKSFGLLEVLKGIDLHIRPGEVVVIIGPSGSGKSTLLRCINLLEDISSGTVIVDGLDLKDKDTDINFIRTEVGMVFQQFNLFPHMTAMENVTLGPIKVRKMPKKKAQNLGFELLRKVGLEDKAHVYPHQLSG